MIWRIVLGGCTTSFSITRAANRPTPFVFAAVMAEGELVEVGVIPTFVSPGAKSIARAAIVSPYLLEAAVGVDVLPDQRRSTA
jgi:hypothetical protein